MRYIFASLLLVGILFTPGVTLALTTPTPAPDPAVDPAPDTTNQYVADCAGTVQGGICFPTNTGLSDQPIMLLLGKLMFWLLAIVGIIAIIAFVIAGMQYLASAGDPKLAEKGKASMLNAIIGIVIALSGLVILQAINTWFTSSGGTVAF